jgi:hypothetical protein
MTDANDQTGAAEAAIRRYLDYLVDPSSVLDTAKISSLEAELASSTDLLKRLHLNAALDKARRADGESVRAGFVSHARAYATTHDLPPSAFRAMGVNDIALAEAGFDLGFGNARGRKGAAAAKSGAPRQRAPKVSQSKIRDHIMSVKGTFTLNDIMGDVGGSLGTVTTVVKELVAAGKVKSNGPDADHHGRGRAPIRYAAQG